jgi:hypothetical protein
VKRHSGQALVEFALVAPVLLLIIGATVDMGRGLLLYSLLSGASRDTARQAALVYYNGSNTLPPNCTANANPALPGTIALAGGTTTNTVYVFIYEIDTSGPNPRWSCPTCAAANGAYVRTSGHHLAVVDLKLKWQPVLARLLGLPSTITFDSQSVERMEY